MVCMSVMLSPFSSIRPSAEHSLNKPAGMHDSLQGINQQHSLQCVLHTKHTYQGASLSSSSWTPPLLRLVQDSCTHQNPAQQAAS